MVLAASVQKQSSVGRVKAGLVDRIGVILELIQQLVLDRLEIGERDALLSQHGLYAIVDSVKALLAANQRMLSWSTVVVWLLVGRHTLRVLRLIPSVFLFRPHILIETIKNFFLFVFGQPDKLIPDL